MGCFHSTMLRRRLDSNTDVLAHVHDMLVLRSQTFSASLDFLPFCETVRLCEPNDVVGLRIDSEYASRLRFVKL